MGEALDTQHGLDQAVPGRPLEPGLGRIDADASLLEAIAALGPTFGLPARLSALGTVFKAPQQAGLISFGLRQKMIAARQGRLESFFDNARHRA